MSYVMKVEDKLTKNHQVKDSELITGFIPQILNADGTLHKLCPICSFENYIGSLNPECDYLWQKVNLKKFRRGESPHFDNMCVWKIPMQYSWVNEVN